MDAYISKPIRSKELFETMETLLHGRTAVAQPENKTATESSAIFNEARLLERTEGSVELCDLLVKTFLQECPTHLSSLRQGLQQQDAKALAAAAHALKGAVANFTEGPALKATKAVEAAAKRGDLREAEVAMRRVTAEHDLLQTALSEFVHRQQGGKAKGHSAN